MLGGGKGNSRRGEGGELELVWGRRVEWEGLWEGREGV